MLNRVDARYVINLLEKKYFLKEKKKLVFFKKLSIYLKYRRVYVDIYDKFKEYWYIFMRFESLFGRLPKISSIRRRRKGRKTKKIIFLRSTVVVKSTSVKEKNIDNVLNYILNLHNYLYIKFLLNKKIKAIRHEELARYFIAKNIFIQHNSISFESILCVKWLDFNRNFINMREIPFMTYKRQNRYFIAIRKLKRFSCRFSIFSRHNKFLLLPLKVLIKNYKKMLLYLFKKLRKRKIKNEKAYILL